tara:strand:- start:4224 stop:4406 length:183 start_codon:yes stop_codon:yes gene_type:complete
MAGEKLVGFNDTPPKGKDVKNTSHLNVTAKEVHQTGTNTTSRYTTKGSKFGKLGAKGHPG